jgi:hypothetical protein
MNRRMVALWTGWGLVLLLTGADIAWDYPRLPERLATHFNAAGQADGWSSRGACLTVWLATLAGMCLLFAGLCWLVRVLPARYVNMPRRDYWFAPGREGYTRAVIGELILWLGLLMLATMSGLNHLTMRANLSAAPDLGLWPWVMTGADLGLMLGILLVFMRRFSRVPQ